MGETQDVKDVDAAAVAATEEAPPDLESDTLTPDEIAKLTETFPHEKLYMPEWRKAVWVWAYTLESERTRIGAMDSGSDNVDKVNRGMIMRVIEAVRVSGEHAEDGTPPARLFDKKKHWAWLIAQPAGAIQRICELSEKLNGERGVTREQMQSFFAVQAAIVGCLTYTASACEACTDCPKKSAGLCPSELYASLWLPT
jgi:hypothetical protein